MTRGEKSLLVEETVERTCEFCEEEATLCHSHLYRNARVNPDSSAYGKADCTFCADAYVYTCDSHEKLGRAGEELDCSAFSPGSSWCSTFRKSHFPHLFSEKVRRPAEEKDVTEWQRIRRTQA